MSHLSKKKFHYFKIIIIFVWYQIVYNQNRGVGYFYLLSTFISRRTTQIRSEAYEAAKNLRDLAF